MKSVVVVTIVFMVFAWLGHLVLPWWYIAIFAFAFGAKAPFRSGFIAFLASFTAVGVVWFISVYLIDSANESILSARMADLMGLGSSLSLMLFTGFTGGLLGGLFCLSGYSLRQVLK